MNVQQSKDEIEIPLDSFVSLSIKKGWLHHSLVIEAENDSVVLNGYLQSLFACISVHATLVEKILSMLRRTMSVMRDPMRKDVFI